MKKQYYLVLDTETTTLNLSHTEYNINKNDIALKKPIVYDIGWIIMDRQGHIVKKVNYIVQEIFFDEELYNSAYYANKRPKYLKSIRKGKVEIRLWNDIITELCADMEKVYNMCAYNASFDFKKAIPYTERFIKAYHSEHFDEWEKRQFENFVNGYKPPITNDEWKLPIFTLRNITVPIVDIWAVACDKLINNTRYKKFCIKNNFLGAKYFKTSAEIAYRYIAKEINFIEAHTALNDAEIEGIILAKALRKGKINPVLEYMPCRKLGTVQNFFEKNS